MRVIEKVIQSNLEPTRQDVVWVDTSDPSAPIVKIYLNGKWEVTSQSGGGDGSVTVKSLTKEEYDALEEKDPKTLYIVKSDPTNGHEWVDLGTVDDEGYHIVWATKNIGAENPWDAGKYFAWADTVGYYADEGHDFSEENAPYWDADNEKYTKYNETDGLIELQPEDDAAHVQWGGLWRMPNPDTIPLLESISNEPDDTHEIYCIKYIKEQNICYFVIGGEYKNLDIQSINTSGYYWSNVRHEFDPSSISMRGMIYDDGSTDFDGTYRSRGDVIRPIIKVKDLSELDITYDIYLGENKIVDNSTEDSNMTNILWADLVALRNNSKLVPGRYYRITDYNTTTAKDETAAAGNQFDIIVLATDVNKLSEDAKAIMHENIYDVTFGDHVTRKCYFYKATGAGYNIVDVQTLLGVSEVEYNEIIVDEQNKTISTENYTFDALEEGGLDYNYFQYCNLEAWEIKYCLDNDIDRFDWAANYINSKYGRGILVQSDDDSARRCYIRYKAGDTTNFYAWAYANMDNNPISKISTVELNIDPEDILYTESENPKPGDKAYFGVIRQKCVPILQISVGTGVIYYMKDEFNNSAPYDFKNILSNITLAFLESIKTDYFIPTDWLDAACGGLPHDGDYYYYLFSYINLKRDPKESRFKEDASVKVYSFEDKYIISNNTVDNSIYDAESAIGNKKIRLTTKNIFVSNSNDVSKIYATPITNNHLCANTEVCLLGPMCNYNFIGEDSNHIVMRSDGEHNTIMENCSRIELNLAVVDSLIKHSCNNILLYGDSNDIEIGFACHSITIDDDCHDIKIGDHCFDLTIADSCEHIKIGSNCNSLVIPTRSQYLIIGGKVVTLNFDDRSGQMHYCNLTFLSGLHDYTVPASFQQSSFYATNYIFGMRSDGTVANGSLADLLNT